ncbi:hypothetical protein BDV26DRAFT_269887 [Aspergillus bertholletiae]|uniref:Uncharacterized protein n=1 Tax=Aspergillus bertholletiae TaxID=1226010 RepID=A0A5N7AXB9_9EURO|nr:hypothetical protein BDV26DRAFT_269887 [Aspergillus bertholletiae]
MLAFSCQLPSQAAASRATLLIGVAMLLVRSAYRRGVSVSSVALETQALLTPATVGVSLAAKRAESAIALVTKIAVQVRAASIPTVLAPTFN